MIQLGGFALYEITGPLLKGLSSLPKIVKNKLEFSLQKKRKFMIQ